MKNKVYKVKELRVDKYLSSYKLGSLNHCKLQFFVEEISMITNFNILTVGTGECSFYALKTKLQAPAINVSYSLSNSEVIFGDLSKVEAEIEKLSKSPCKTIVLMTCIPSIMNLDLKEFISQYNGKVLLFMIPEFSGYSVLDFLPNLYEELFKNERVSKIKEEVTVWEDEFYSYEEIIEKLKCKKHIVTNYKYLKMLDSLKDVNNYEIEDRITFKYEDFMDYLESNKEYKEDYLTFLEKMKSMKDFVVLSNFYTEFASIFRNNNIEFNKIILNSISKRRVEMLRDIDEDMKVEFSEIDNYRNLDSNSVFDTLSFDYDYFGIDINLAMVKIIRSYLNGNM